MQPQNRRKIGLLTTHRLHKTLPLRYHRDFRIVLFNRRAGNTRQRFAADLGQRASATKAYSSLGDVISQATPSPHQPWSSPNAHFSRRGQHVARAHPRQLTAIVFQAKVDVATVFSEART